LLQNGGLIHAYDFRGQCVYKYGRIFQHTLFVLIMLGFSEGQSALEKYEHYKSLLKQHPKEFHPQLELAYRWISSREFSAAMDTPSFEAWKWAETAMPNPPIRVLRKHRDSSKRIGSIVSKILQIHTPKPPSCRMCSQPLAKNILETVKFTIIICDCKRVWCHDACAAKQPTQCQVCTKYIILSQHRSSIRSTVANRERQRLAAGDTPFQSDSNAQ